MPNVIVLDDEEDLSQMVSIALAQRGLTVLSALAAEEFYALLQSIKPDAILMDIYLGAKDGREICRQLKANSLYNTVPVLLYSAGNISKESIRDSLANDFMPKPFNITDLADRLYQLINGK